MRNRDASLEKPAAGLIKYFACLGGACLIGMTLAAAAIGLAPETTIDPGLRTLAAQESSAPAPSGSQFASACRLAARQAGATATSAASASRPVVCEE